MSKSKYLKHHIAKHSNAFQKQKNFEVEELSLSICSLKFDSIISVKSNKFCLYSMLFVVDNLNMGEREEQEGNFANSYIVIVEGKATIYRIEKKRVHI